MWLLFAVLSGAFYTGESLLQRFHLRNKNDSWTFAFAFSLVGTIVSFPFMLTNFKAPNSLYSWLLVGLVGLLIVGNNLLLFRSSNFVSASITNTLLKLRLVWVFVLGILILHNPFSWQKLLGTLLTIIAGWLILHSLQKLPAHKGVSLVLWATFFNASIIILSKYLLGSFSAVSLTFFVSYLPATIILLFCMPQAANRIKQLFTHDWKIVFLACALGAFSNLSLNAALALHDAASVIVINEVFLILVLVGEHLFLKEKEQAWIKLASVVLAITGAIIIEVSH